MRKVLKCMQKKGVSGVICIFYAILMRTKKFETRLQLNSNYENYDIELKKYLKKKDNNK